MIDESGNLQLAAIKERVKVILTREAMVNLEPCEVDEKASLLSDYYLDSIQILELLVGLEEEFDFSLEDEDLMPELFESVNSVADYVAMKLSKEN